MKVILISLALLIAAAAVGGGGKHQLFQPTSSKISPLEGKMTGRWHGHSRIKWCSL